jgi:hypothetical protein
MSKDDGTPKLLIEAQSLFGGNKTEVVQVDSNTLDPIAQAKQNAIAAFIHPDIIDTFGDAACWFCGAAFFTALYFHTPVLIFLQVPVLLILLTGGFGGLGAMWTIPELTWPILFRFILLVMGCTLGAAQ